MISRSRLILLYLRELWAEASQSTIPDDDDPDWEHFNRVSIARWKIMGLIAGAHLALFLIMLVLGLIAGRCR